MHLRHRAQRRALAAQPLTRPSLTGLAALVTLAALVFLVLPFPLLAVAGVTVLSACLMHRMRTRLV